MVKVSVLIPAYNEEKYIADALKSVLNQDFEDVEIIVINDGSEDRTKEIIESIKDKRIKLINLKKNKGRAGALNEGIKYVRGKYVAFLDADDIMTEDRLKKQVEFLDNNPNISMVYGDMIIIKDKKKEVIKGIKFGKNPKDILVEASKRKDLGEIWPYKLLDYKNKGRFIPGGAVMVRGVIFEKVKFDENLRNSEDYDLWFQIIGKGFKIAKINFICFYYRKHKGQKSSNLVKMKTAARYINIKLKKGVYFK